MESRDPPKSPGVLGRMLSIIVSSAFLLVIVLAVLSLDGEGEGLASTVAERLPESGVDHPPTAVLLNFRAYDTWLEVAVLLLAALGVLALRQSTSLPEQPAVGRRGPVLAWLVQMLIPLAIVTGMYLLWRGTAAPGGAFQAGAVIGGGLVLLRLSGYRSVGLLTPGGLRASLLAGFAGFLLIATALHLVGWAFLEYPPSRASLIIVLVELLITWTVAVSFVALLVGARPDAGTPDAEQEGCGS